MYLNMVQIIIHQIEVSEKKITNTLKSSKAFLKLLTQSVKDWCNKSFHINLIGFLQFKLLLTFQIFAQNLLIFTIHNTSFFRLPHLLKYVWL